MENINKVNLVKHIALFVAVMTSLFVIKAAEADLYTNILTFIGCWQIGSWFGNYVSRRWPLRNS